MERLSLRYKDALRASTTLKQVLREPFSVIVRDAAIQRFEYTFEALWKFLKEYLKDNEGIIVNTPKAVFREAFAAGIFGEDETIKFLEMTDSRNNTSHTYKEEIADAIYEKIRDYSLLIEKLLERVKVVE